jgi:hypothetical protein
MTTYKLIKGGIANQECSMLRDNGDGSMTSFLIDPANTDYQAYLQFLADGGQPLPADDNGQAAE